MSNEQESKLCRTVRDKVATGNYATKRAFLNWIERDFRISLTDGWIHCFLQPRDECAKRRSLQPANCRNCKFPSICELVRRPRQGTCPTRFGKTYRQPRRDNCLRLGRLDTETCISSYESKWLSAPQFSEWPDPASDPSMLYICVRRRILAVARVREGIDLPGF
jgi:hypothetical protein